jgi:hypothetical protein
VNHTPPLNPARAWGLPLLLLLLACADGAQRVRTDGVDYREGPTPLPTVGDQGESKTCVAWALGYGAGSYMLRRYAQSSWDPTRPDGRLSASYLYNYVLQTYLECDQDIDVTPRMLIQPSAALAALVHNGISKESSMPFTVDSTRLPSEAALREAAALECGLRRVMQYELDPNPEENDWDRIKTSLRQRGPAVFVVQTFVDMKCGSGVDYETIADLHKPEHRRGQHAFLCVGYEDEHVRARDGARIGSFLMMSSWGRGWGQGGFAWMPYSVLLGAGGEERLLRQAWYVARDPPADCPDLPPRDCEAQLWLAGNNTHYKAEAYDTCGASVASSGAVVESTQDIVLPVTVSRTIVQGPAIPCVPSLFESRVVFTDVTDTLPAPPAGEPPVTPSYRLDPEEPSQTAIGAWVQEKPLLILDRARSPTEIVVRAEAFRPGPGGHLFMRKTLRVTVVR